MAELIEKGALIEKIKKEKAGNDYMCRLCMDATNEIIDEQPTTTEAEIRAKAIDEFAEKFIYKVHCEGCSGCTNCYETGTQDNCDTYRYFAEAAEELKAEQLKEE